MAEILDCPFCGTDDVSVWYKNVRFGRIVFVECDLCGAKSKAFMYYSKKEEFDWNDTGVKKAIDAWNRRKK